MLDSIRSGVFDDVKPSPRTPAQQAASRSNGCKSRGPATVEGKARSAMNAMRHGLFATRFKPPDNHLESDRLFHRIYRGLVEEFQPVTFSEDYEITALAHDLVRAARVRELIEAAARPQGKLSDEDADRYKKRKPRKRLVRLMDVILEHSRYPRDPLLDRRDAQLVAQEFVAWLPQPIEDEEMDLPPGMPTLPEYLCDPPVSRKKTPEQEQADRRELREWNKLLARIEPFRAKFQNVTYVAELLSGNRLPDRGEWSVLLIVLRTRFEGLKSWLDGTEYSRVLPSCHNPCRNWKNTVWLRISYCA
ncbi:MAG: hypothetical protein FWD61_07535 [Phycisphaerales bacterium]|nr:hypothetical protein [Phycisphaerales bacterium]